MANEFARNRQDASVNPAAIALPAGASTTVNGASIDLSTNTAFHATVELELVSSSSTLSTSALPDTRTLTYTLQESTDDTTFTDVYVLSEALMTGAGGAGDTANTARFRLPSDISQYIRVECVSGVSVGDCSGSTMALTMRF